VKSLVERAVRLAVCTYISLHAGAGWHSTTYALENPKSSSSRDANTAQLLHWAESGADSRVRIQSILALGKLHDPRIAPLLFQLVASEREPDAVRKASEVTLERLGPYALQGVSYLVRLGSVGSRAHSQADTELLRRYLSEHLRGVEGIAYVPTEGALSTRLSRLFQQHSVPVMRVEGSVVRMTPRKVGRHVEVRCEVALTLVDSQSSVIRGMLRGVATGREPRHSQPFIQEQRLKQVALSAAVRSAVSGFPQAIAQLALR
jgi:hypothetical protein